MRSSLFAGVVLIPALVSAAFAQQRPEALEHLEAYRAALRTGQVEWSDVNYRNNMGALRGVLQFMTSKFADETLVSINRGDKDGVIVRDETGASSRFEGNLPHYRLQARDGVWERADGDLRPASLFLGRSGVSDPRSLGAASYENATDIHDVLWRDRHANPVPWRYEESRDGDLYVVRVHKADSTTAYWLDPQHGWSPVRVRDEYPKQGWWSESRSSLKETDGVWFPEVVEFFDSKFKEGREPVEVIRVYGATFNRPEHAQCLSLADIGVDVGSYVTVYEYGSQPRMGRWDGQEVIAANEFAGRRIEAGAAFKRQIARIGAQHGEERTPGFPGTPAEASDPALFHRAVAEHPNECESLWEAYTRNFINKYKLHEEQTQRALTILRDCQDLGGKYLAKHRSDFEKLDQRAKKLNGLDESGGQAQRVEIQRERERLAKPLDDIFEQQLKPRLDKLPTRAQRKAAEPAASQPVREKRTTEHP